MPMQARSVQVMVARDHGRRLARGEAAVDLGPLEMLTCFTGSAYACDTSTRVLVKGK
jgi:hypothetical protein